MRVVIGIVIGVIAFGAAMLLLIWGTADRAAPTVPPAAPAAVVPVATPVDKPPAVQTARILVSVPFRTGPGEQAPVVMDEFGENEVLAPVGRQVTVLERRGAPDSEWARVYVHTDPNEWPGDFFAWLPVDGERGPILELEAARPCPATLTLETIAALSPFERVACAGDQPITLDARSGFASEYVAYQTQPAFFGSLDTDVGGRSLAPISDKLVLSPQGFDLPTFDVFPGPGVQQPPIDFDLRVTGSFADPRSAECRRTKNPLSADPAAGLPEEAPADSEAWCRTRFVVTGWEVLRGPERRPLVPGDVQLHRIIPGGDCGGVGMDGPLTLRIDPSQPDSVWIEGPTGRRSLALFPGTVRYQSLPGPSLVTGTGLVLRDGATFDPDAGFPGLPACPGGEVITFGF